MATPASTVVRRFQCSSAQARAWAAEVLSNRALPVLQPERRQADGDLVLWEGLIAPGLHRTIRASDVAACDATVDPYWRFADLPVDLDALCPLARWLCERRRAFRYETQITVVYHCTVGDEVQPSPALVQMYGKEHFDQAYRAPLLWREIRETETGAEYLTDVAANLLRAGAVAVELRGATGQVERYEIDDADRQALAPRIAAAEDRAAYLARRHAEEAALRAEREADPDLVEELALARELGVRAQALQDLRRGGPLTAACTGPAPCVWYHRADAARAKELLTHA